MIITAAMITKPHFVEADKIAIGEILHMSKSGDLTGLIYNHSEEKYQCDFCKSEHAADEIRMLGNQRACIYCLEKN